MYAEHRASIAAALLALLVTACGGDDAPPAPPIGAAGGTVTGPNGASVVVPAGALAQDTNIAVEASEAGAPPLPAGLTKVGPMHTLTPHGTTFAAPVMLTVPFDPAQVAAGGTVQLLKTNAARDAWEPMVGATLSGATVSAPLGGFSWVVPVTDAPAPAPAPASGTLSGNWTSLYTCETSNSGFSGEDTLVITQDGAAVSFTASDGAKGTGTVSGDTVTWSAAGPGYTERGTWTILDADSMIKRSAYTNTDGSGGGTCAGSIHKN